MQLVLATRILDDSGGVASHTEVASPYLAPPLELNYLHLLVPSNMPSKLQGIGDLARTDATGRDARRVLSSPSNRFGSVLGYLSIYLLREPVARCPAPGHGLSTGLRSGEH